MKNAVFFKMLGFLLLAITVMFIGCDMTGLEVEKDAEAPVVTSFEGATIAPGQAGTISVAAKVGDKGRLEYQWYSYKTPAEYENHSGEELFGATSSEYTTDVFPLEGVHTFYVIITNINNKATGKRVVSTQSASIQVSVNDPNNAAYPAITAHPQNIGNVVFRKNMDLPVLKVEGSSSDGGEISYQWYVTDELTNESGEEILDATASEFRPVPPAPGNYYYFVKVTNTNYNVYGRRQTFVLSNPALVQVIRNPNAEPATIGRQPSGAIYFQGDTIRPITIIAEAEDGGELSYQWQVRTSQPGATVEVFENVTTGTGAETASFTPGLSTATITTTSRNFYRVVITNNNEHVTEEKVAVINSNAAEVVLTTPAVDTSNLTITIGDLTGTYTTPETRRDSPKNQFVRGFGVMDVAWGNFPNLTMEDVDNMYNPDKLGYNVLRNMILPHNEDPIEMLEEFTNTDAGRLYYDTVRRVNSYGGYVLSSPWTPPAVWKSNNSTIGTNGKLREIYYRQYANYLRTFAQAMANNGAPIYTISIQNEPNHEANYDGCNWTGSEMRDFFVRMGYFTRSGISGTDNINWATDIPGYGGGKAIPYVLAMSGSSANNPNVHSPAMSTPNAKKNIAIISRHPYGSRNVNMAGLPGSEGQNPATVNVTYDSDPREIWQTEFNLNTVANYNLDSTYDYMWAVMNSIDIHIRNNHENVYVWWAGKRFYSMLGEGEYSTAASQLLPRAWAMAHWAKFANETYHVGINVTGSIKNASDADVPVVVGTAGNLASTNFNPVNYTNLGAGQHGGQAEVPEVIAPKVAAFVKLKDKDYGTGRPMPDPFYVNLTAWSGNVADIEYISFVMFTPTANTGANGFSLGDVKLVLPPGFKVRGAEAMRSSKPAGESRDIVPVWETVGVSADRNSAYVNLPRGQMLSVRLFNE